MANDVDQALRKYDIDTRSCVSFFLCDSLQKSGSDDKASRTKKTPRQDGFDLFRSGLARYAIKNKALAQFMGGANKISEIEERAGSGASCRRAYDDSKCPWSSRSITTLVTHLLLNSDVTSLLKMAASAATS